MSTLFDPYHRWLGIRPEEQPADHYRLLGLARYEDDFEVIRDAAERQMAHVRRNTLGAHAELARQLLNELGHAKACLMDHATKAAYDESLNRQHSASHQAVYAAAKPDVCVAIPNADLEAQRRLIVQMCGAHQWREMDSLLQAMRQLTDPASVLYVEWAEQQLVSLHALLQQKQQAAAYAVQSARALFANQEYGEAAQKLLQVDKQLRTPEINELLDKAMELQEEVDQLIAQIEFGLRDRMRPGTLRNVQRLMELKPKDRVARDLYRKFRWQTRAGSLGLMLADALAFADYKKSPPFHEEPLLRKWLALAALVGLLAFGLTSWGLFVYLRGAKDPSHGGEVSTIASSTKTEDALDSVVSVAPRLPVDTGETSLRGKLATSNETAPERIPDAKMPEVNTAPEVAPVEPARHVPVGRYISEEQVLGRFDDASRDWYRMVPDTPLFTGQRVVVLPTFRPQLLLDANVKVTVAGESHLQFGQTKGEAAPLLQIESGRVIIVPLSDPKASVHLEAAGRSGSISFADTDSSLAMEVFNYLPPGRQPDLEPAIPIIQFFALSGHFAWREEGTERLLVSAGQVLTFDGDGPSALFETGELPGWVFGQDLADVDRLASAELRRYLTADRPLCLSLLERTEFRQVEVRSLACRSLCSLDIFDSAINALEGGGLRTYWSVQFDAIRGAMARDPESAVELQHSLDKLAGEHAGLLYRLFCGFSPETLAAGGAKQLVDALEHERIGIRVVAYENLRRITGETQLFRPEQPPAQQTGAIIKWRRNLEAGLIVYLRPPVALPPRRRVATQ